MFYQQENQWISPENTLERYLLNQNDILELKKIIAPYRIKLFDDLFLADFKVNRRSPLLETVKEICILLGLNNYEEYILKDTGSGKILDMDKSILEQPFDIKEIVMKRIIFFQESPIDKNNSKLINFKYLEYKEFILSGRQILLLDQV